MPAHADHPGTLPEDVWCHRNRTRAPESDLALAVIHKAASDRDLGFFEGPGLEVWLQLADCDLDPATIRRRLGREGFRAGRQEVLRVFNYHPTRLAGRASGA